MSPPHSLPTSATTGKDLLGRGDVLVLTRREETRSPLGSSPRNRPSVGETTAQPGEARILNHLLIHPQINEMLGRVGHHARVLIADGRRSVDQAPASAASAVLPVVAPPHILPRISV